MKKKQFIAMVTTAAMLTTGFLGAVPAAAAETDTDISCTLTLSVWEAVTAQVFEDLDLVGRFQEIYPNVDIEIEQFQEETEYFNSMRIRASANELPDLMFHKSDTMNQYAEYLVDLTDTEAAKDNLLAEQYAVDGKVLGVPDRKANDYVYYWTDMFEEAGVEVPATWEEFKEVCVKLQEYYGEDNPDFAAICMGAKDSWTTYPFMEYGPASQSGNGYYWDYMATVDDPFADGTDIHTVYEKILDLFNQGVLGKDPLGITYGQSRELFAKKNGAMVLNSPMFLTAYKADGYDTEGMSTFYLPFRDSEDEDFNLVAQGDFFLSVTTHSENPEVAKAFVEFYYSDAWYPDYISAISSDSTMSSYPKELDPVLAGASEKQPDVKLVTYGAGQTDFNNMVSETKFDCKQLGTEMLTEGFDLEERCEELNQAWNAAREKLGLK